MNLQYKVPTGDAEEEAIATRALHSKEHKDFANRKSLSAQVYIFITNMSI